MGSARTLAVWLLLFVCVPGSARAEDPGHQQVLVLHSYHLGYVWTSNIHDGFLSVLRASKRDVDVRTEYLDWKHFPTEENLQRQRESLRAKYASFHFDLVLASDNKATEFALAHREELFPGVPIVFTGFNGWRPGLFAGRPKLTGVAELVDVGGTLRMALDLFPAARHVTVVCDRTETGRAVCDEARQVLAQAPAGVQVSYLGDQESTDEVLAALAATPEDTVVLVGPFNQDRTGRFLDLWELADLVRARGIHRPVFHLYQEALRHGVLGGSMMSGVRQGEAAGGVVLRVLSGVDPERIPVATVPTVVRAVDYREMQRFGLGEDRIPADCEVLNPPRSWYEQHRAVVLGALVLSLLALVSVTVLLVFRMSAERVARRNAEQLQALVNGMPILACAFDASRRLRVWNRACEGTLGYSMAQAAEALAGQENWSRVVELALGRADVPALELELRDRAGEARTIRWFSEARRLPVPGWAGWAVGIDVTAQRRAEAERARLALAVSQTADAVVLVDEAGRLVYGNAAAAAFRGTTREQLVGTSLATFVSNVEDPGMLTSILRSVQAGATWRGQFRTRGPDGTQRTLEGVFSPLGSPEEPHAGITLVLRDVTEQLAVEEQLRRTQRLESLGALAGGVAHDFGNLLTTILGNSELMTLENDPSDLKRHAEMVTQAATRGTELVKQLLRFARAEPAERDEVDVHAVLRELQQMLGRTLNKNHQVVLDLGAAAPRIRGNSGQVMQVLLNLALNARDAMPKGGKLTFATRTVGELLEMRVIDTGTGMTPEVMARIFDPFFTTKPAGKGTGMGLAMSYSIVKSHGGSIEPQSEPGVGTTFVLRFPLVVTAPERAAG